MGRGGKRTSEKIRSNICANCGNEFTFTGVGTSPKYCSENCKKAADLSKHGVTVICKQCGNPFVSINLDAKYCSKKCAEKSRVKEAHYRTKRKKTCPVCGKEFETIIKSQICCSPGCGCKQGHEILKKYSNCQYCGKPFWRDNAFRMKFCSRECRNAAIHKQTIERHRNDQIPMVYKRICPECGSEFVTNYSNHIYCSDACCYEGNLRMKREQWNKAYVPRTFICKECGKEVTTVCGDKRSVFCSDACMYKFAKQQRNEQIKRAFRRSVRFNEIYKRDGGICQICGLPVANDKSPEKVWAATIDHIIPLSIGGTHEPSNCQLGHRLCNSMKQQETDAYYIDWQELIMKDKERWSALLEDYKTYMSNTGRRSRIPTAYIDANGCGVTHEKITVQTGD